MTSAATSRHFNPPPSRSTPAPVLANPAPFDPLVIRELQDQHLRAWRYAMRCFPPLAWLKPRPHAQEGEQS